MRKLLIVFIVSITILSSFIFRFSSLSNQGSFWVDEFSSGVQARSYLQQGFAAYTSNYPRFERNNVLTHFIIASSFLIFGESEESARLPSVIIGSLVPIALFFLARKLYSTSVALSAMILTSFLYLEILWSVQARGYVLQQLLIVLTLWFYMETVFANKIRWRWLAALVIVIILGLLAHSFFVLLILALGIHLIFTQGKILVRSITRIFILAASALLMFVIMYLIGTIAAGWSFLTTSMFGANNLWYYHSFLWGEYTLVSFLGLVGLFIGLSQKPRRFSLLWLYLLIHLLFITFGFGHYLSKYLLPIIPLLIIGAAISVFQIAAVISDALTSVTWVHKRKKSKTFAILNQLVQPSVISIVITLFIIANGHPFVTRPKTYYSLNKDFREIANIDYDQVYQKIQKTISNSATPVLVIETWPDRANWYLGNSYPSISMLRWQDQGGITSGHLKSTSFGIKGDGTKFLPWRPGTGFIGTADDLRIATDKFEKGFIWIDDASLPTDVISYAEQKLKKELYLDHYPLDDNPYSIWPGTLYSWGVD